MKEERELEGDYNGLSTQPKPKRAVGRKKMISVDTGTPKEISSYHCIGNGLRLRD